MPRPHDRGGWPTGKPIDRGEHVLDDWEARTDAILFLLTKKGITTVDQHRRTIENIPSNDYEALSYYEKWAVGIEQLLVEKGIITKDQITQHANQIRLQWNGDV